MSANFSDSAERALIGAILCGSDYSAELLQSIAPRMFYAMRHQDIWETAGKIITAGVRPDIVGISDELERRGRIDAIGGRAYLMDLADEHISDSLLDGHSKLVREYAINRAAGLEARKISSMVEEGADAGALVSEFLRVASELSAEAEGKRRRPELASAVLGEILNNDPPEKLETGFGFIDKFTRISPENFVVIGARPGSGKSSLGLGIALAASMQGKRVLFNCLEMSTVEMTESMLAHETEIKLGRILARVLDENEKARCRVASQAGANIVFSPQKTMPELIAKTRSMKANGGIDLVITDFLQKMNVPKAENRTQEVGAISRAHKELAMDFRIPVIGLSQLSRAGAGVEPTLKDLRESGDLEQDANAVYFLWKLAEGNHVRGFSIAKDRRGAGTDAMRIAFDGSIVKFDKEYHEWL